VAERTSLARANKPATGCLRTGTFDGSPNVLPHASDTTPWYRHGVQHDCTDVQRIGTVRGHEIIGDGIASGCHPTVEQSVEYRC
jgi:hypothetical protein